MRPSLGMRGTSEIFADAGEIDATLKCSSEVLRSLFRKRVPSSHYNRETLFKNMADGRISLFADYPIPRISDPVRDEQENLAENVTEWLRRSDETNKYRVKTGQSETFKYYTLGQIADKWANRKALISVTDLHIRGTGLQRFIDPEILSAFNLYCECDDVAASLEMMTMVVSSRGNVSDSHSDDSDGSNHCFVGRKLWLAWDTHDGLAHGLQDLERVDVTGRATFDMETFLSLRSSRWFVVDDGCTLFFPGHLTHKVITLENYVGVGSFYIAPANCLRTLSRWLTHPPNWQLNEPESENQGLVSNIRDVFQKKLRSARVGSGKRKTNNRWGLDYVPYSIHAWERQYSVRSRRALVTDPDLNRCLKAVRET